MYSYTHLLTKDQAGKLRSLLDELGFEFSPKQYTRQKCSSRISAWTKAARVISSGPSWSQAFMLTAGSRGNWSRRGCRTASESAPMRGFELWRTRFEKIRWVWWKSC